jgi:lipopolysaccharide heptosyltransferase II
MKILIIRLSSLGDVVITQPVVARILEYYPQAEVYYLVKPAYKEVVQSFPEKFRIIEWGDNLRDLLKLSRYRFDLVIDLHNKPNTALIRIFCRAKRQVIYNKERRLRKLIVAHKTDSRISSTLDLYNSALKKLGIPPKNDYPKLNSDYNSVKLSRLISRNSQKLILIFPGATSFTKRWLLQNFAELINLIGEKWLVVIAGSRTEIDLSRELEDLCKIEIINLTDRLALNQLISLIAAAAAVIANDSGPAHLAAALGKPQITIFGATSPKLGFAPLNDKNISISKNAPCSPCSLHGSDSCPLGHFDCMKSITVQEVYEKLMKLLN